MGTIADVFPRKEVLSSVPDCELHQFDTSQIKEIIRLKPRTMHEMGLSTWHAALMSGQFRLDPQALSKHVDSEDPNMLRYVGRALSRKVIFDLSYTYGVIPGQDLPEPAIQATIAHLFPNRLHIGDVKLLNPHKPRPEADVADDQSHESLRLFQPFMENCRNISSEAGIEKITLTAAYAELVEIFQKYGFEVEDSEMGRMAVQFGVGVPMEIKL